MERVYEMPEATPEEITLAIEGMNWRNWGWDDTHAEAEGLRKEIRAQMEADGALLPSLEESWARVLCTLYYGEQDTGAWERLSYEEHAGFMRMGGFFAQFDMKFESKPVSSPALQHLRAVVDRLDSIASAKMDVETSIVACSECDEILDGKRVCADCSACCHCCDC